tara:strand:+ start:668 stop:880 length:213 start_codon:yes stop_codon:yes gene_type:complete
MIAANAFQIVKNGAESASTPSAYSGLLTCFSKLVTMSTGFYNEFSGHKGDPSLTKSREGVELSSLFQNDD